MITTNVPKLSQFTPIWRYKKIVPGNKDGGFYVTKIYDSQKKIL